MQYKKQIINDNLLKAGKEEFLKCGYKKSNIALIAKNADVPLGNLYRYFDGKKGLLDAIVSHSYESLPNKIQKLLLENDIDTIARGFVELFKANSDEILLLIERCEKTAYSDFIERITQKVFETITQRELVSDEEIKHQANELIASSIVNSILEVFRKRYDESTTRKLIKELLTYFLLK